MAELDETGLTIKRLAEIETEIENSLKASFGDFINTLPQSVFGQLIGIFAEREALIWELVEDVYNSQYPDSAEGVSLDRVGSITAFTRLPSLASVVDVQAMFGAPGTVVPQSTIFSVNGDPDSKFQTDNEVTLIAGTDEVQDVTFSAPPTSGSFKLQYIAESTALINWNNNAATIQSELNSLSLLSAVTVSGSFAAGFTVTFAGADGKQEQPLLVATDNTLDAGGSVSITVTETTPGVYQGSTTLTATEKGPIVANSRTLTVIDSPISGLDSVFNPEDAEVGRDVESDAEFRIRRETRLQISLAGPLEAIRSAVLELNDVAGAATIEDVKAFENVTLSTDSRGIPGKAFEIFVYEFAGTTERDSEVRQAIFNSKPAGIESHGGVSGSVTDSQGFSHTIKFSRPAEIDIWLELDLTVDGSYPTEGDTLVEDAMVSWGNGLGSGQDVIVYPTLVAQLNAVPGITDVVIRIGVGVGPTLDDNIDIDDGSVAQVEISRWDTSRITVTS